MIDLNEIPRGWEYCRDLWTIWNGEDRTIYKDREDGVFSISENQVWIPGCYGTIDAAILACSFDDEALTKLQDRKIGGDGVITLADLQSAKGEREE